MHGTSVGCGRESRPVIGWNFEKGCEETNAYTVLSSGSLFTPKPGPVIDPDLSRQEHMEVVAAVHKWQQTEAWLKNNAGSHGGRWGKKVTTDDAVRDWEKAEMAIAGWQKRAQLDTFRSGYLEFLAKGNQVADQVALTDLEIEALPLLERIVAKGYRELAKSEHPDVGGDAGRFDKLKTAKLQLDRLLVEMGEVLRDNG